MGATGGVGTCPTPLDALPADSRIMYIQLNAGGSTAADSGFIGRFDNVAITSLRGLVDTYDFEAQANVPEPGTLVITGFALALLAARRLRR